jgi:hypothetical protein
MRDLHAKCHEFSMHRNEDMCLSLISFSEICTIVYFESWRFEYMRLLLRFKGFQTILFHIFVSYILFVTDFQSS